MLCPAGFRELDADSASVARVPAAHDQAVGLEPVDVPREGGAFDMQRLRELLLCSPGVALEVGEDEPCRQRPSDLGERVVERAPDALGRVGELEADRGSLGLYVLS